MDILSEIAAQKRKRVDAAKVATPLRELLESADKQRQSATPHRFREALSRKAVNIIAEFKRRSPSKGLINAEATPELLARSYASGGAAAMSVLTEEDFFDGSIADFVTAKDAGELPMLRKDFILDEYQVYESAAIGADAVLLIVALLDDATLIKLRQLIEEELAMDALIEVHDSTEMQRAINAGGTLVGVNNRDLRTFNVSLDTSIELAQVATPGMILVSESGISSPAHIRRLSASGYRGFLVGESLMRAENSSDALRELIG